MKEQSILFNRENTFIFAGTFSSIFILLVCVAKDKKDKQEWESFKESHDCIYVSHAISDEYPQYSCDGGRILINRGQ